VFGLSNDFRGRLMYTPPGRPESLISFIEPTTPDEPLRYLTEWNETLYAVTSRRWYEIRNTDEPFFAQEVLGVPGVITSTPTFDPAGGPQTIVGTPRGIYFQAQDGVRLFDGQTSRLVSDDALSPVFRGSTSDGIAAFNGVVASYGRDEYLISDVDNTTLAMNIATEEWREVGPPANALFHEPDTRICLASVLDSTTAFGFLIVNQAASTYVMNNTTVPFTPFGQPTVPAASAVLTNSRAPSAFTITDATVLLSIALGGAGTASWRVTVNGVDSAPIVTISSGASSGTGSLSIPIAQDDLITIHATFTGTTTNATVRAITFAYSVPI